MKFFINQNTIKKNGKSTVYIVCHLKGKTVQINTRVDVEPARFDDRKGLIKGNTQDVTDNNMILRNCAARINEIFVRYRLQSVELTPDLLLSEYKNPSLYVDFFKFMKSEIEGRAKKKEIAPGTYKQHMATLSKMMRWRKTLSFAEISPKLLNSYAGYLRTVQKNATNTVHRDMKTIKTYCNIAVCNAIIKSNPFDLVKLKTVKTNPLFLTENELRLLYSAYKKQAQELSKSELRTLRHFLFMSFTGVRVSDLSKLEHENIREGVLCFVPHKTGNKTKKEVSVLLPTKALDLIRDEGTASGKLFATVSDQKMNAQLKLIARKMKVDKEISNHTARHTFATLFVEKTKDVASLQKLLGHARLEETMKYVHLSQVGINEQMLNFERLLDI